MSGEPFIHPLIQIRPAPSRRIAIEAFFFRNLLYFRLTGEKQLGSYISGRCSCKLLDSHWFSRRFFAQNGGIGGNSLLFPCYRPFSPFGRAADGPTVGTGHARKTPIRDAATPQLGHESSPLTSRRPRKRELPHI